MRRYKKSALAAAVTAALVSPAALAEVDTSAWKCEYCPFEQGYRAEFDAGASYVSDDALRFGNGTGYDEKGAYAEFDGEGRYANDGTRVDWEAKDLGLESAAGAATPQEEMTLEQAERLFIQKVLARHAGDVRKAAEQLGMSRSALYRRIQQYGL